MRPIFTVLALSLVVVMQASSQEIPVLRNDTIQYQGHLFYSGQFIKLETPAGINGDYGSVSNKYQSTYYKVSGLKRGTMLVITRVGMVTRQHVVWAKAEDEEGREMMVKIKGAIDRKEISIH